MKKVEGLDCILLVDDDEATNFIHRSVIRREELDVHVQVSRSGEDALNYLSGSGPYFPGIDLPQPGIIFLDLNMPGMNGWEFLDQYKKLPEIIKKRIALLILTTSINPDDEQRASAFPELNGYVQKPLTSEKLQNVIHQYFEN